MFTNIFQRYFNINLIPLLIIYVGLIGLYVLTPESIGFARTIINKLCIAFMFYILIVAAIKLRD